MCRYKSFDQSEPFSVRLYLFLKIFGDRTIYQNGFFLLSISTQHTFSSRSRSVTLFVLVLCCNFVMLSFFLFLLFVFALPRSCWAWPQMPARSGRRRGGSEERRGRRPHPSPSRAERIERQTVRFLVFSSVCLYFSECIFLSSPLS